MYAMVNVQQYQIVATGSTVAECEQNYRSDLVHNGLIDNAQGDISSADTTTISGVVSEIRTAVINGNSQYFLQLQDDSHYYVISAADDADAVILNVGDRVELRCSKDAAGTIVTAYSLDILR